MPSDKVADAAPTTETRVARRAIAAAPRLVVQAAQALSLSSASAASGRRPGPTRWVVAAMVGLLVAYAGYVVFVQPDQYVVETRFAVRSADSSRMPAIPGMAAMPGGATDSHAVVNFLRSADAARELGERLDLVAMFGAARLDRFSRLPAGASLERVHRYLGDRVRAYFDHTSGIVIVEARAYAAADAFALAQAIEALSEDLVNRMSLGARRGLLSATEAEVASAEQRLADARDALRAFRESNQLIDPRRSAEAESMLRARLDSEIASLNAQVQAMLRFAAPTSPPVVNLRNQLEALQQESRNAQARAASVDPAALSAALRGFETLETNVQVAQRAYEAVLTSLERARGEAGRQQLYLARVVRPTLPAEALLPRRVENIATAAALLAVAALLMLLVLRTVREHVS